MNNECKCQIPNTDLAGRCFKCGGNLIFPKPPMSNNQLPADVQERIQKDADKFSYMGLFNGKPLRNDNKLKGYIVGATAERVNSQQLIDRLGIALENVYNIHSEQWTEYDRKEIRGILQQWKEQKEVDPVKEIEYMPIHPEDARKPGCPKLFPMHLLSEEQAMSNHGQSLKRLKERGGLGVVELLAVYHREKWNHYGNLKWEQALKMLNEILTNPPK